MTTNPKLCESDIEALAEAWSKAYKKEYIKYSELELENATSELPGMYHALVHSCKLKDVQLTDRTHSVAISELITEKEEHIQSLLERQSKEVVDMQSMGVHFEKEEIDQYTSEIQVEEERWMGMISELKETQKQQYRDALAEMNRDLQNKGSKKQNILNVNLPLDETSPEGDQCVSSIEENLQESFTIHLGAQMKQMHNLRLLSTDWTDFCFSSSGAHNPHRLQTSLSLYSNNLSGFVLLVENMNLDKHFQKICLNMTDLHFPELQDQYSDIKGLVSKVHDWRKGLDSKMDEKQHSAYLNSMKEGKLQPGDLFITKHSNLNSVHVVFHLIVDKDVFTDDLSSRHSAILGLRNIFKVATICDISNVSFPLLLVQQMLETMTISWCLKRAELVFKCVKGFMLEMNSWGGSDNKTVQFLVPKGISEDLFFSLAKLLPSVFRVPNPLVAKSNFA